MPQPDWLSVISSTEPADVAGAPSAAPSPSAPPTAAASTSRPRRFGVHVPAPRIFYPALGIIVAVVLVSIFFPVRTGAVLAQLQTLVVAGLGPYYLVLVAFFVIFALWMGLSRFGDIKLGQDDDKPEFGLMSWFSMLFAAGMGIGLVFWGAAEPLTYFLEPKPGVHGSRPELAAAAMSQTFLHWGFHAWAVYAVVGLSLAYAIHRKGRPVSIRWALEPLLGDKVKGRLGDAIDVTAIVGTLFGVATSLGLGVKQIAAGLRHLGVVDSVSNTLLVVLIVIITLIAIASVVSGVGKGIKWLSNINLGAAALFLVAVLLLGPTMYLLRVFVESLGGYLQNIVGLTFDASAFTGQAGLDWQGSWTVFYWGWWISWAPFVGVFIARISRGRTVREFVAGVLLVPTLVTFLWFAVMGGSVIKQVWEDPAALVDPEVGIVPENVLFDFLAALPFGPVLAVLAVAIVAIFFITSADSGSLVIDMLASGGETDPPKWSRILWASLVGVVAIALLLAGGLSALQTGAILTAIPVSVVMIGMCIATYRAFRAEHQVLVQVERRVRREEMARRISQSVTNHLENNFDDHFGDQMDGRISAAITDAAGNVSIQTRERRAFWPRRPRGQTPLVDRPDLGELTPEEIGEMQDLGDLMPQDPQPTADTSSAHPSAADHAEPDAVTPDTALAPDADPEDPRTS
ncbi:MULTISPECIES: BCCT family transporter [unclassified Cryobacterium]|uniref:BCCT family transporter n=1 Tax=unclassified Cryobacterium TaxID=2649013 RepID=UPI00106BB1F0|nr:MULTISPECIES: BCCT family transporter [unclassified Cryobacterium]TFC50638.1 BCCT family transporter [Cryobacterium sp. TMB3-1-2]TFC74252.1 BCCT family transporter [Cryobacterium sp. TMB3-10]TFC74856.1 BCCT family transporter [Cryobacterium sp. TMB3-15]TFD41098.1 BCCT family transporter [Cryobacterium sp. TMB3-12]